MVLNVWSKYFSGAISVFWVAKKNQQQNNTKSQIRDGKSSTGREILPAHSTTNNNHISGQIYSDLIAVSYDVVLVSFWIEIGFEDKSSDPVYLPHVPNTSLPIIFFLNTKNIFKGTYKLQKNLPSHETLHAPCSLVWIVLQSF